MSRKLTSRSIRVRWSTQARRDIDNIRNVCRCNTYPRIRDAIKDAANNM